MKSRAMYGLVVAVTLLLSACNSSDTNMSEAFWCASYGTCKPSQAAAYQAPAPTPVNSANNCAYYGTCGQQQPAQAYDACAFYGICDRGGS